MCSNLGRKMRGGFTNRKSNLWWKGAFLTGMLIHFFIGQGSCMYFSQSELKISRTFIPDTGFLYAVKAIVNKDEDGQVQYSISKAPPLIKEGKRNNFTKTGKCPDLSIDGNLGNISIVLPSSTGEGDQTAIKSNQGGSSSGAVYCKYQVFARLVENGTSAKEKIKKIEMALFLNATLPLTIISKSTKCWRLSDKELCFAGISRLNLTVMENAPVTPVAYLGSLPGMCADMKISYNVSIPEGVLSAGKTGSYENIVTDVLTTQANLDREDKDIYNVSVTCILEPRNEVSKFEVIRIDGQLNVLDENDNAPKDSTAEEAGNFMVLISLSNHEYNMRPGNRIYSQDHSNLLARDLDTVAVNKLEIHGVNDTKKLLDFKLKLLPTANHGFINSTAIIIIITFSEHVRDIDPWDGYYCVLAILKDTALIPSKQNEPMLNYTVCINWGKASAPTNPPKEFSQEDLTNRLNNRVGETTIPRSIQNFAPVLYPFPDIVEDFSEAVAGVEFSLTHIYGSYEEDEFNYTGNIEGGVVKMTSSDYMDVFQVTPNMGIIYVVNQTLLSYSPFKSLHLELFCNSTVIPSFSTNLTIYLDSAISNDTDCEESCSFFSESKYCEQTCGAGSNGKCSWRYEPAFNNSINDEDSLVLELNQTSSSSSSLFQFPTCSPHLASCPDRKCDELEELFPSLCPQDCADELLGFGQLIKRSNGKLHGINDQFCKGVGSCQNLHKCGCAHVPNPIIDVASSMSPETRMTPNRNLPFTTTVGNECGQHCVLVYSIVGLVSTIAILTTLYVWKQRITRKRKSRSLNQSVIMTANGIEMPYGDNTGHGTLMSDVEYGIPRGMNHATMLVSDDQFAQHQVFQVESKWEISREDLALEHVLGEGQFGRVLKGRLHGHSGAHIPVAVKILKVDASEGSKSLWQEFMAEFSLLKQVDHPNVIKLLGACTAAGGTPYLVMEYAEYGALRSFLRKCRRVEKISGSNGALHWDNSDLSPSSTDPLDLEYVVTPREVLGFSWQIAKGMAYLSDMKMVHRDLAARNILLTKQKFCKISDFGLTRDIYVDDAYQKKSKDRVPVKWLAPECLADELYTTKSDVWAFGILVWELTTLGASPYPGIQTEQLYSLLNTGYRMPQPHNCSNELYTLMRRCWAYQPTNRPTFHQILLELAKMLEDGIEYLKLDVPSVSNPGYDYFSSQQDRTGSEVVNLSPPNEFSMAAESRPMNRRKLSMENLRLIDYEISTDDEILCKRRSESYNSNGLSRHTYINDPNPTLSEQDCSSRMHKPVVVPSSSGYESPIKHSASIAV